MFSRGWQLDSGRFPLCMYGCSSDMLLVPQTDSRLAQPEKQISLHHCVQDAHALAQETIKAANTVYAGARETPLQPADWLSEACGAHVLLKLENKQVVAFHQRQEHHQAHSGQLMGWP